eukprot:TRINITY_DN3330_c0_g1_i13.p2 TRINITY_DN3330_c0_g1~~TRINITY_DN3330_c0_g1_i13.p2  ORF type:complete len:144 (-),score=12.74 TRINITY_DN3330_c0_g1_i13:93-482(-)
MLESSASSLCPLSYPDRYNAAVFYIGKQGAPQDPESQLLLYALEKQATVGPNTENKPWGWNQVEYAKWQAWKELKETSKVEAMRLYVRTVEMINPNWWQAVEFDYSGDQENHTTVVEENNGRTNQLSLQ